MDLQFVLEGRRDLAGQIYRQIRAGVLDGRLHGGEPIPPTRELARWLSVSRNTVAAAYDRLVGEGFLVARVGAGTFVNADGVHRPTADTALRPRSCWTEPAVRPDEVPIEYDLRPGLPDPRLFPYQSWRRAVMRSLRVDSAGYGDPAGHLGLRTAIARHIAASRSIRAEPDDLVITHGAQQALDLIGRVLIEPGDVVAVEDPGYPPARRLFRSLGAQVVPVPVDGDGLVVSAIPSDTRVVYTTPSHQFPLGMPMSLARRVALVRWAAEQDAAVIEDDYDSEYRFGGRPIEPMFTLDRGGRVLFVGSFSSTLLPAIRLGFLITPDSLRAAFRAASSVTGRHPELPMQQALTGFIDDGLFARHIRRMRNQYQTRREYVREILQRDFGDWLAPVSASAGLHVAARLRRRTLPDTVVVERLAAAGVAMRPLSTLCAGNRRLSGLVIGYGAVGTDELEPAFARLRAILT
jgi:GntR family transcriptional regulator / MocR family aminotransferase